LRSFIVFFSSIPGAAIQCPNLLFYCNFDESTACGAFRTDSTEQNQWTFATDASSFNGSKAHLTFAASINSSSSSKEAKARCECKILWHQVFSSF
jgi:hypothetical protein